VHSGWKLAVTSVRNNEKIDQPLRDNRINDTDEIASERTVQLEGTSSVMASTKQNI
jgi:hypothetical protein